MEESFEIEELNSFYKTLKEEIVSVQSLDEDGGFLEQIFTRKIVELLEEAGETENAMIAYHEYLTGKRNQHKINAYSISDNYETIDLFISIFNNSEETERIGKKEIDKATSKVINFYNKCRYKNFRYNIEESSEIFDFARTLSMSEEINSNLVRVNIFILTDGLYSGEIIKNQNIQNIPLYFRVIDINYIHNISTKTHIPIKINFSEEGYKVPCIVSEKLNNEYQCYLAVISGKALASIYEKYGSRLLEQNVRSFLQFTGKINKGIRNTIQNEKHMFLAYNNGISATADKIETEINKENEFVIKSVENFQIVNGGQTTASIYHTMKKDKADISEIFVQLKITVVFNKENFNEIVSKISEFANTQNKVSVVDLSSNQPFHIEFEKLSRNIWARPADQNNQQTRWFYERARGQYKNALLKYGYTKARKKSFEERNPKNQVFKKEDLGKFVNSWKEIYDGKKLVIGPNMVVKGNQKNYVQFMNYNLMKNPDSSYYEDCIAKAILFKNAEKIYGVKPNSIGDMRYITVPYSIAWLGFKLNYKLDLYKIWLNQDISFELKDTLKKIMSQIEDYIKEHAPGSLYAEWAKKEECWIEIKNIDFDIDLSSLKNDIIEENKSDKRFSISEDQLKEKESEEKFERINFINYKKWKEINDWGEKTGKLSGYLCNTAFDIYNRLRVKKNLSEIQINNANKILDLVISENPDLLSDSDNFAEEKNSDQHFSELITLDLIKEIVEWDFKEKKLDGFEYNFMKKIMTGEKELNEKNILIVEKNYKKAMRFGFRRTKRN